MNPAGPLTPEGVATLVLWEKRAAEIHEEQAAEAARRVNEEWKRELDARARREEQAFTQAMVERHGVVYRTDQPYSPPFWRRASFVVDAMVVAAALAAALLAIRLGV